MAYLDTSIRSSLPQEQWRRAADATEARRVAVAAASRRRAQQAYQQARAQEQSASVAARDQFATLRREFEQQQEALREAMLQHFISEFEELRRELRLDAERQLKHRLAELEHDFEHKLAGLRMPRVRGTHSESEIYLQHDVCTRNGNSYIAKKDQPGSLPGPDWQLLSMVGKTGAAGARGFAGPRGPAGESGANFVTWKIDRTNYSASPLMSDGTQGPKLYLRELFEQYHSETDQSD